MTSATSTPFFDRTFLGLAGALIALLIGGLFLPQWALSFGSVALYLGIVVLGMALLMRTGLVSFGQGLYYCLGAYAAGTLDHFFSLSDLLLMVVAGALLAGVVAGILGLLLSKYRDIFFAMLSLAFSMILYGLLVKTSQLGSTDGFGLSVKTFAGVALSPAHTRYVIFAFASVLAFGCAVFMHRYWCSHLGRLATAIRDNELRVEYMGESVQRVIHLNYVISAAMAGIGGALMAGAIGHVDARSQRHSAAQCAEGCSRLLGRLRVARTNCHGCAFLGQRLGYRKANAFRSAEHHRRRTGKFSKHAVPSVCFWIG